MPFVHEVCRALDRRKIRYALVGGYAVALHGAVRGTLDIDIVVNWSRTSLERSEQALVGLGLVSRLPVGAEDVFRFRDEYIRNRNLVAWNFYNPQNPAEQVDLVITYDLRGRRRQRIRTADGSLQVLSRSGPDRDEARQRPAAGSGGCAGLGAPVRALQTFSDEYLERCRELSPDQIVGFLEDFRRLHGSTPAPTKLISLKVPEDLLRAFRARASLTGIPYQTQIKQLMRAWVLETEDSTRSR